jgi:hypothetical protein
MSNVGLGINTDAGYAGGLCCRTPATNGTVQYAFQPVAWSDAERVCWSTFNSTLTSLSARPSE